MKTYALPRKTLLLWRIRTSALTVILLLICIYLPLPFDWTLIISSIILFLFSAAFFWYLPKFIKSCRITFANDSVIIKRGVIVENTHILPFTRLIHTQSVQTPLAKLFSLTTVLLKAARFRIFIPELSESDAKSLIRQISAENDI